MLISLFTHLAFLCNAWLLFLKMVLFWPPNWFVQLTAVPCKLQNPTLVITLKLKFCYLLTLSVAQKMTLAHVSVAFLFPFLFVTSLLHPLWTAWAFAFICGILPCQHCGLGTWPASFAMLVLCKLFICTIKSNFLLLSVWLLYHFPHYSSILFPRTIK